MVDRLLTLPQKQAYQGAKSFFVCFIPTVLVIVISMDFYLQGLSNLLLILIASASYICSLKYYILCNKIDTHVQVNSSSSSYKDISQADQQSSFTKNSPTNVTQQIIPTIQTTPQLPKLQQTKPPKYTCKKCNNITIPYRSKHCRKCQICIQRYDHHCFWIGNCVGYKNHRQFYIFLFLQTINNVSHFKLIRSLHLEMFRIGFLEFQKGVGDQNGRLYLWGNVVMYGLELCAVGFIVFTGYLLLYHTMLMSTGMTTWQHMSRSRVTYLKYLPVGLNPFSKGVINNIKQFWVHKQQLVQYDIPTYQEAQQIGPQCGVMENKYYSCC